ncbi:MULTISPECIES: hypothetical protein [unclassified Pseudoalteromonas]|uniref:hypothetical protein n=1 Tax=unclassified Pseudoalteromonas TaxID=194690 RepID=UPI0015FA46F5|nr:MULTISPECIES: hypothetical protein [unclassified Pseudoalteromonas]MBB1290966.1 hypothetical protein [Pseudoalteromonas sp. SR41-5]MBB1415332.1 hypothetical protein [Pseudoalteromonas sp. SG43-8]
MLSLNKTALLAAVALAITVGGYVVVNKYNNAIELSTKLAAENKRLNTSIEKLGGELQSSEADKLKLIANNKLQEQMFNEHLATLNTVNEQQTVVQTELKEVFIYEQVNKDWGNTMLPDDVSRVLLDATRSQSNNNNKASAGVTSGIPP